MASLIKRTPPLMLVTGIYLVLVAFAIIAFGTRI